MESRIVKYIEQNKVFTLATAVKQTPYCANCYYVFDEENQLLIFLSDDATRHIKEALVNQTVAGTIQNGVTEVAKIQGIQFRGAFILPNKEEQRSFYEQYYNRFPFAKKRPALIWAVQLNWVKMTDNTLGFGTKLIWERDTLSP